ncbi:MAG: flagellar motor protein MotB [Bdellovibrionota bacterium]
MKKKHPEHVNLERWLVSYADFITLLFAFFVVMYALSQADMAKFKQVAASLKAAFSGGGPSGMIDIGGSTGGNTVNPLENLEAPGGRVMDLPAGKTNTAADPDPALREVKELLEETISLEAGVSDVAEKVRMEYDSRGLVIKLAADDFFDHGQVEPDRDLLPLFDRIGRVIARGKQLFRIEGHIDATEIDVKGYTSGWELSTARAAWLARYWMKRFNMDPQRVGVAGYSHYRPLSSRNDEWGRARNRRVEIVILNNRYESN